MEESTVIDEQKYSFRWLVLVLLFLNIFVVFLSVNCIPPLFKEIGEEIPLTKSQMGMAMGVLTLASLFFALIGGGMSDKVGSRWAMGFAILIISIGGVLRATAGSAYSLSIWMFLMGVGVAIFGPNMPKALGMWFPHKELALANGICIFGMGLAGAVGMGTAAGILSPVLGGWRNVLVALGILTFITGLLWMVLFRDRVINVNPEKKKQSMMDNFKSVFKVKSVWWLSAFYGLNMVGLMSIITLLPHSLSERGMSNAKAGGFVAIMMGMTCLSNILGGLLSDWAGKRKPFIFLPSIIMGACIFSYTTFLGIPLIITLIIGGVAIGTIAPIFMTIPVEIKEIGPALAATAMGLVFMIGNTCGFIGPIVSGKLMDLSGAQWPGFLFMGITLIMSAFCILPVKETGQKKKEEA
jgi:cyanate permease